MISSITWSTRQMNLFFLIVSICWLSVNANICNDTNKLPKVLEAFRVSDKLFLLVDIDGELQKLYKLKDFQYKNELTVYWSYSDIVEVKNLPDWFGKIKFLFTIKFTAQGQGSATDNVIGIGYDSQYDVKLLKGWVIKFDDNYEQITNSTEFNVNLYKYVPGQEPLNLMSLFQKFPQQELHQRMAAITPFPSVDPYRAMVYFNDKPDREEDRQGPDDPGFDFRRHIMVAMPVEYDTIKEFDWRHDIESGNCYEQNIINAAVALNDEYSQPKNGGQYFDLIEFDDKRYFVKRVFLDGKVVRKDLKQLKTGTVAQFLQCEPPDVETTETNNLEGTEIQDNPPDGGAGIPSSGPSEASSSKKIKTVTSTDPSAEEAKSKNDTSNAATYVVASDPLLTLCVILSMTTFNCIFGQIVSQLIDSSKVV